MSIDTNKKTFNPFDKIESKEELAVKLGVFSIGSMILVSVLDLASLAVGFKSNLNLPVEVHATNGIIASTFLGYLIGKKENKKE